MNLKVGNVFKVGIALIAAFLVIVGWWRYGKPRLGEWHLQRAVAEARSGLAPNAEKCRRAMGHMEQAIKWHPILAERAYFNVMASSGSCFTFTGNPDSDLNFIEALGQAARSDIVRAFLAVNRADLLYAKDPNQCGAVEESAREAIRLNPEFSDARRALGLSFWCRLELNRAIEEYRRALDMYPGNVYALNGLGVSIMMYAGEDPEKFEEAAGFFKRATAISPKYWKPHYNLGFRYYLTKGDYQSAIRYMKDFLLVYNELGRLQTTEHPFLILALTHGVLGDSYYRLGDGENAKIHFQELLKIAEARPDELGYLSPSSRTTPKALYYQSTILAFDEWLARARAMRR